MLHIFRIECWYTTVKGTRNNQAIPIRQGVAYSEIRRHNELCMIQIDDLIQSIKIINEITDIRFGRMFFAQEIGAYLIDYLHTQK